MNYQEKIDEVENLISEYKMESAFDKFLILVNDNLHREEKRNLLALKAQYNRFQNNLLVGLENHEQDLNRIIDSIMKLLYAFEDKINHESKSIFEINKPVNNDDIIELIKKYQESSNKIISLTDSEIEDLINTRIIIYKELIYSLDQKLSLVPAYGKKFAKTLFDKALNSNPLEPGEIDAINIIRKNAEYDWMDRSLIVSSLYLGILNKFDEHKLGLLIDFLTDFEDGVWQKALTSIVICVSDKDEKIYMYPSLVKRLQNLQDVPVVQDGIILISMIISFELHKLNFLPVGDLNSENVKNNLKSFGLKLHSKLFKALLNRPRFVNKMINKKSNQVNGIKSLLISQKKIFEQVFFKDQRSWFLPFSKDNPVLVHALRNTRHNINPSKILKIVYESVFLSDIEKYSLCINLDRIELDTINELILILDGVNKTINAMPYVAEKVIFNKNEWEADQDKEGLLISLQKGDYLEYFSYLKSVEIFSREFLRENLKNTRDLELITFSSNVVNIIAKEDTIKKIQEFKIPDNILNTILENKDLILEISKEVYFGISESFDFNNILKVFNSFELSKNLLDVIQNPVEAKNEAYHKLKKDPEDKDAFSRLILALNELEEYKLIVKILEERKKSYLEDDDYMMYNLALAESQILIGNYVLAIELLENIFEKQYEPFVIWLFAKIHFRKGEILDAKNNLDFLLTDESQGQYPILNDSIITHLHIDAGNVELSLGNEESAFVHYKSASDAFLMMPEGGEERYRQILFRSYKYFLKPLGYSEIEFNNKVNYVIENMKED